MVPMRVRIKLLIPNCLLKFSSAYSLMHRDLTSQKWTDSQLSSIHLDPFSVVFLSGCFYSNLRKIQGFPVCLHSLLAHK